MYKKKNPTKMTQEQSKELFQYLSNNGYYKMTKARFNELGLGYDLESCKCCDSCIMIDKSVFHCDRDLSISINDAEKLNLICPCIDEDRIKLEMTSEEYDAYRHNKIIVED